MMKFVVKEHFPKQISNIKYAIKKKINVHITTCVNNKLVNSNNKDGLFKMIEFAKELGVNTLNMHDLFKSGIPRDLWSGGFDSNIKRLCKSISEN